MIDNSSIEYKSSISDLVDTINSNKMFSKLILYSLNTLKSYLVVQNQSQATDNSINILQSNYLIQTCLFITNFRGLYQGNPKHLFSPSEQRRSLDQNRRNFILHHLKFVK